jgi:hypothetical protein
MSEKHETDRTFERAWGQGIKVADGLRRRPTAVRSAVLRPWRKSTHPVDRRGTA